MDDKQIVDLYWERSETAISETAKKYGRYCHYIAFNVLHNDEDSEETGEDVTRDDSWSRRKYKTAVRFILHGDEKYSGFLFAALTVFLKNHSCVRQGRWRFFRHRPCSIFPYSTVRMAAVLFAAGRVSP